MVCSIDVSCGIPGIQQSRLGDTNETRADIREANAKIEEEISFPFRLSLGLDDGFANSLILARVSHPFNGIRS